jgi:U3 small nucleolar RNA-associated protein 20
MGEERFEQHLKQVVANISYEYQEGRISGIILLTLIVEKLPEQLLQRHSQILFLPLVLQLLNDDSKDCREHLTKCIILLLKRSSTELLRTFQEYCSRWSQQTGPLRLASLQIFGHFIDTRADFLKSSSLETSWMNRLEHNLQQRQEADWEITYFSLICVEKLIKDFKTALIQQTELLIGVTECLTDPHPWIRLCSSRILNAFFISNSAISLLSQRDGMLFEIVRNLLFQLNVSEEDHNQDLSDLVIKTLTFALPLMSEHPQFCYAKSKPDDDDLESDNRRDPVFWLLRRLSQIVKNKGSKRRMTVYKCFAAFSASNFDLVAPHLELMLEGLHRTSTEAKNEIENKALSQKRSSYSYSAASGIPNGDIDTPATEHSLAEEVLRLLEDKCTSPSDFLNAYAEVKRRALTKKRQRITEQKVEAIQNPQVATERRIKKQENNKKRRKKRADEHRIERGGGEKKYRMI